MRLTPVQGLLKNLRQEIPPYTRQEYLSKEDAHCKLVEMTGQDFGYDAEPWKEWIVEQQALGVKFRIGGGPRKRAICGD